MNTEKNKSVMDREKQQKPIHHDSRIRSLITNLNDPITLRSAEKLMRDADPDTNTAASNNSSKACVAGREK